MSSAVNISSETRGVLSMRSRCSNESHALKATPIQETYDAVSIIGLQPRFDSLDSDGSAVIAISVAQPRNGAGKTSKKKKENAQVSDGCVDNWHHLGVAHPNVENQAVHEQCQYDLI